MNKQSAKQLDEQCERARLDCVLANIARQHKEASTPNSVARNFWRFLQTEHESNAILIARHVETILSFWESN